MPRHSIVPALCAIALVACASHPSEPQQAKTSSTQACDVTEVSPDSLTSANYRLVPPHSHPISMRRDPYPEQGKRRHLEGRVLASFQLGPTGAVTSAKFVRAQAPYDIKDAACHLLHSLQFDVANSGVDPNDARPFLMTIRYCISNCSRVPTYPDTKDITITGSPLPP